MKNFKNVLFVYFLFLITLGSCCLSPKETNGSCTKCIGSQILQKGFCYEKIKGCLIQKALECTKCQNGYVSSNQQCIRQALFYNKTDLTPPPVDIRQGNQKLNPKQIRSLIINGYEETKDTQNNFYIAAKKKLLDQYPFIQNTVIYKTDQQVVNGKNFIFYMIDLKDYALYLAKVHVNQQTESQVLEIYKNQVSIKKNSVLTQVFTNNWEILTNFQDPNYIEAKKFLLGTIKELLKYQINKVEYQNVAGLVFLFEFTSNQLENNIFVKVFRPFYGNNQILGLWQSPKTPVQKPKDFNPSEIQKFNNQKIVEAENNSYKNDPIFNNLFDYFKNEVKVVNLAPISKVEKTKSQESDYWIYQIIFSPQEYAVVNYYPNYSIFEVISYIAGQTQLFSLESLRKKADERSEDILLQRLQMQDPAKFTNSLIRLKNIVNISAFTKIYQLNVFTIQGNYNISILDRGQLFIIKIQKLSDINSFSIDTKKPAPTNQQQSTIQQLKVILLSKFTFSGYELISAVVKVAKVDTLQYVLLWSRVDLRKIRVLLEITDKKVTVKKIVYVNDGMYIAKEDNTVSIQAMARRQYAGLKDFEKVQSFTNGSMWQIQFVNSTHIWIYTKNVVKDISTLELFQLGKSVKCPEKQDLLLINFKGKCYSKIQNCGIQLGNTCSFCNKQSIQINGKCVKDSQSIFSDL